MKKLFLFCLIFYSNVVLSDFSRISAHSYDSLVGVDQPCSFFYTKTYFYTVNQTDKTKLYSVSYSLGTLILTDISKPLLVSGSICRPLGWISQFYFFTAYLSPNYEYLWAGGASSIELSNDYFLAFQTPSSDFTYYLHDICERDQVAEGNTRENSSCDLGDDPGLGHCNCPNFLASTSSDYLVIQVVKPNSTNFSISEKTLQTTNALISESNSKLGSIATSNAINSNLLSQISQGISNLSFNSSTSSGSSTGSGSGTNTDSTTVAETCFGIEVVGSCSNLGFDISGDFSLDSISFDVSSISPNSALANSQSSCPSDYSFSAFNRSYSISYLPLCDLATRLRSIVIPAARVAAAWIVIGAL